MDRQDSLVGFNANAVISYAKQSNVNGSELRNYIKQRHKDFITQKYYPKSSSVTQTQSNHKPIGGGAQVMAAPCVNEGFENTPSGDKSKLLNYFIANRMKMMMEHLEEF